MSEDTTETGWLALVRPEWLPALAVLLGGVLLHSMNVLLVATILPSIVDEVGGAALMSWPITGYLGASIVAAASAGQLTAVLGAGRAFSLAAMVYFAGTLLCALAASMPQVIAGRVVQGFGGGLLTALAYVLVRKAFPEGLWPRVFALLSSVWSISVLVGPLVGGVFASYGYWRGALLGVAVLAIVLSVAAFGALPRTATGSRVLPSIAGARIALICAAIAAMSLTAVVETVAAQLSLIVIAIAALATMLRINRSASTVLLPRSAFTLGTATGIGLWIVLLLSVAFSPLHLFAPVFLQKLHGLDPLSAGYATAAGSMSWTLAAIAVAGLANGWPERMIVAGPLIMGAGLLGLALLMPSGPVAAVLVAIVLVGAGMGAPWAFNARHVMSRATPGEEDVAAASVATVQQTGFALGAALAGLVANAAGFADSFGTGGIARAAFWVPVAFMLPAGAAVVAALRLGTLVRRV